MKAWLPGEHKYVQVTILPKLQHQFAEGVRKLIVRRIEEMLGGVPVAWRWEKEGEDIVVGAAL